MARPRFTTDAYRDLDEIVRYVGERDPAAATRLLDRIDYDATCYRCTMFARRFEGIFRRRDFIFAPLQTPALQPRLRSRAADPLAEMRVLTETGDEYGGADAMIFLARQIWWTWPFYAVAHLPGMRGVLRQFYRWIAARRSCTGSSGCALHARSIL